MAGISVLSHSSYSLDAQDSSMGRKLQQADSNSTAVSPSVSEEDESEGWLKGVSFKMNWVLSYREISKLSHNLIILALAAICMGFLIGSLWMGCSMCLYPSTPAQPYRRRKDEQDEESAPVQQYTTDYNADTNEF